MLVISPLFVEKIEDDWLFKNILAHWMAFL